MLKGKGNKAYPKMMFPITFQIKSLRWNVMEMM